MKTAERLTSKLSDIQGWVLLTSEEATEIAHRINELNELSKTLESALSRLQIYLKDGVAPREIIEDAIQLCRTAADS